MKRQEKGFSGGNHEVLKAVSTTTATKKKGKARVGKQQQGREDVGKKLTIEEKRADNNYGGELAESSLKTEGEDDQGLMQPGMDYWGDDDHHCLLCAVVEQISWGTCGWSTPFWDTGLMSRVGGCHHHHNHHPVCSDVLWDDCIWDLKDFKDDFDSAS